MEGNGSMDTSLREVAYDVFYDGQDEGYRASGGTSVVVDKEILFSFQMASDTAAGLRPFLVRSHDGGKSWTVPRPFPPDWEVPKDGFVALSPTCVTTAGTLIVSGIQMSRGVQKRDDILWRPSDCVVGRSTDGGKTFDFETYESGTFLGEQFIGGGFVTRTGRVVLTLWGAREPGDNWQCGVLVSDDDGLTWRYNQVGYNEGLSLRDNPKVPVGFNEQTLYEANDGQLVSIIRGREKLGRVPGSPKDTYYFRSASTDAGETWSPPVPTNFPGTGAPAVGAVLPDGSFLLPSRIAYQPWYFSKDQWGSYGLVVARSTDLGQTWKPEVFKSTDPRGYELNHYYATMNGHFLRWESQLWYAFGVFDRQKDIHRQAVIKWQI